MRTFRRILVCFLLLAPLTARAQVEEVNDAVSHTISLQNLAEKIAQGMDRIDEWTEEIEVLTKVREQAESVAGTIRDVNTIVSEGVRLAQEAEYAYYYLTYLETSIKDGYEWVQEGLADGSLTVDEASYMLDLLYSANETLANAYRLAKSAFTSNPKDPASEEVRKSRALDSGQQAQIMVEKLEKPMRLQVLSEAADESQRIQSQVFSIIHSGDGGAQLEKNVSNLMSHKGSFENLMLILISLLCMFYTGWTLMKVGGGEIEPASGFKHVIVGLLATVIIIVMFLKVF